MPKPDSNNIPASQLYETIQALIRLIAETESADPVDAQVMEDRRLYRACLDWRLTELVEQSCFVGTDDHCH